MKKLRYDQTPAKHTGSLRKKYAITMIGLCCVLALALSVSILVNVNATLNSVSWAANKAIERQTERQTINNAERTIGLMKHQLLLLLQAEKNISDVAAKYREYIESLDWVRHAALYDGKGLPLMLLKKENIDLRFNDFSESYIYELSRKKPQIVAENDHVEILRLIQLDHRKKLVLHVKISQLQNQQTSGTNAKGLFDQITSFAFSQQLKEIIKITILIAGLGALVAIWFAFRLTQPINLLAQTMRRVANGDFGLKAQVNDEDEIGELAQTFNLMTQTVSEQQSLLADQVTDLSTANQQIQRSNEAMRDLLSRVSHELRTPMNAVLGFAQIIRDDDIEPLTESQLDSVNEIITASDHLLKLINDILELSRLDAGAVQLLEEDVSLLKAIHSSISMVTPQAIEMDVKITCDLRTEKYQLLGDQTRLLEVFINILSNAVKYNRVGGSVTISAVDVEDDMVDVTFADTGVGISDDQICNIFQPFNRLNAEASNVEGTGIGMSITQKLIEQMGGAIRITSQLDVGTSITLRLPLYNTPSEDLAV